MKRSVKIIKLIVILIAGMFMGMLFLGLVYALPTAAINKLVEESVGVFTEEGTYPVLYDWCTSQLDNYTDALMLEESAYPGNEGALEKGLLNFYVTYDDMNQTDALIAYYSGNENYEFSSYGRYWHGYLIFLKPLLMVMNYSEIRILNGLFQGLLTLIIGLLLWKKKMRIFIVPYLITLFLLVPLATVYSLQYSTVFYVMSIATIVLLLFNERWIEADNHFYFFLILGMATSYFDLLTYPLLTFGIPVTFYFCMNDSASLIESIKKLILFLFCWGTGYVGMWAGKWILGSLFTDENLIVNALSQITLRTSHEIENISQVTYQAVVSCNLDAFLNNPGIYLGVGLIIGCLILILIRKRWIELLGNLPIFGIIFLLPFLWYAGTGNHSGIHNFFTHKELAVSAFALMCLFAASAINRNMETNDSKS